MSKIPQPPQELLTKVQDYQKGESGTIQALEPLQSQQLTLPVDWPKERLQLLKKTLAKDLSDLEFELFVDVCRRRKLDPFARQVYAVKRAGKLVIQTGIDGFRVVADRSNKYAGQVGPYWCGKDGQWMDIWTKPENPFAAKVGVLKAGFLEPAWGVAYWAMYASVGPFWQKGGPSQLAKCAEALALRKAFPEDLSGLYTSDEMMQAGEYDTEPTVPIVQDEIQPVMIFPTEVKNSWTESEDGVKACLFIDSGNKEWIASGEQNFDAIDVAISNGGFLLVNYVLDTGRRVIMEIVG